MDTRAGRYFKWLLFWQQQGRCCYCGEHGPDVPTIRCCAAVCSHT
jgi:hypothetical protein